jgi:hypothetical protein
MGEALPADSTAVGLVVVDSMVADLVAADSPEDHIWVAEGLAEATVVVVAIANKVCNLIRATARIRT